MLADRLAVITPGLIGVAVREPARGITDCPALLDVGGDRDGIAGTRVRATGTGSVTSVVNPDPPADEVTRRRHVAARP